MRKKDPEEIKRTLDRIEKTKQTEEPTENDRRMQETARDMVSQQDSKKGPTAKFIKNLTEINICYYSTAEKKLEKKTYLLLQKLNLFTIIFQENAIATNFSPKTF